MSNLRITALLAVFAVGSASAGQRPAAPPAAAPRAVSARTGFSTERLARLDKVLQQYVDDNRAAGIVALVLRDGQPVYEKAFGWSDKEAGRRMTTDTVFRIASQSKAITSVAVLALLEEGKLALNTPVSTFIPSFAKTTVAVKGDTGIATVPAKRAITIRDLLTHTAGISYGTDEQVSALYEPKGLGPAAGYGWYTADKDEPICDTMDRLGTLPFVAQPGEAWVYGYNTDILGCIVERASGMPLDQFIASRITRPLGLKDTEFFLPPDQRARLAVVYGNGADGKIGRAPEGARGQGHYVEGPRRSFAGGAGLLSTARDYARFLEMIRRGGTLDGVRILAPRTVALMTTNQVGNLYRTPGLGFGLGFETTDVYGAGGTMASVGSFGWGGAYGTTYKVDPEARLVLVMMVQLIPNTTDIAIKFQNLVYQALVEPMKRES
jgi:CubicO group peptidase (beta-lactamase class C family)